MLLGVKNSTGHFNFYVAGHIDFLNKFNKLPGLHVTKLKFRPHPPTLNQTVNPAQHRGYWRTKKKRTISVSDEKKNEKRSDPVGFLNLERLFV